jgi:hypothetical protein
MFFAACQPCLFSNQQHPVGAALPVLSAELWLEGLHWTCSASRLTVLACHGAQTPSDLIDSLSFAGNTLYGASSNFDALTGAEPESAPQARRPSRTGCVLLHF